MQISIEQIITYLKNINIKCQYNGPSDLFIEYFCALSYPKAGCITWIKKVDSYDFSNVDGNLNMLFVANFFDKEKLTERYNIIECDNPKETFFEILNRFFVAPKGTKIESDSVIETERIGKNVTIGHHCYICKDVTIGDDVVIKNNVVIECPAQIGDNTIIWSGVVIGTDGYGYFQKKDGINYKVPHFGGVTIGENVEIGANTCIDRGTLADTVIGNNVKIDNLCHIAHNVQIGDNAMVIAMSMIAGSSVVGESAYIAPGALVMNQKTVGKNAFITMGAVVMNDVPENTVVFGIPARVLRNNEGKNNNAS